MFVVNDKHEITPLPLCSRGVFTALFRHFVRFDVVIRVQGSGVLVPDRDPSCDAMTTCVQPKFVKDDEAPWCLQCIVGYFYLIFFQERTFQWDYVI